MRIVFAYLKHLINAKGKKGKGISSSYLSHLVSEIIYDFTPFYCYETIETVRKQLLSNNEIIEINDLGAGSRKTKSNHRKIAHIAKYSLKPAKQAQLLFRLVNYLNPKNILEIGTSLGITTSYLAKVASKTKVITIEGCPNIAKQAKKTFNELSIQNINLYLGDFNQTLNKALKELNNIDFIFFDGNHTYQATLDYFHQCLAFKNNNTVFVFDDIYLTKEMDAAWNEIITHPEITASIDLFHMGIVFFKEDLSNEHIKIRF